MTPTEQQDQVFQIDWGLHTLLRLLSDYEFDTVLDIGSGQGEHARLMRYLGKAVFTVDLHKDADYHGDFLEVEIDRQFDVVWCSHVLEHQRNVGVFLEKLRTCLTPNGILALTVPSHPRERLVAGHVTTWNAGLLAYNLVLAGFDCSEARFFQSHDLGFITRRNDIEIAAGQATAASGADLASELGGEPLDLIARFFPFPVTQGCNAERREARWGGTNYMVRLPDATRAFTIRGRFLPPEGISVSHA